MEIVKWENKLEIKPRFEINSKEKQNQEGRRKEKQD